MGEGGYLNKKLRDLARNLRDNSTDTENYIWRFLRNNQLEGFKFRRQHPIGKYIVDFVNLEKRIIVEVDGAQHLTNKEKDRIRDAWFKKEGFRTLRFWDNEVLNDIECALEIIRGELLFPSPEPSPAKGRGRRN